jgi:hypothetical protein
MLNEVGGKEIVGLFTEKFYQLAFQDPHLDRLIREHQVSLVHSSEIIASPLRHMLYRAHKHE